MVGHRPRLVTGAVIALFVASGACLAIAPALMPESYSWVRHAISDSAAQGVAGAWVARLGFVLSAGAVLLLATNRTTSWGTPQRAIHGVYGALVLGLAVFSQRPWMGGPFDEFENAAHSVLAPVAGVVFTAGVLVVVQRRKPESLLARGFDWVTISTMAALPFVMLFAYGLDGVAERIAVAIGYAWYVTEALRLARAGSPTGESPA